MSCDIGHIQNSYQPNVFACAPANCYDRQMPFRSVHTRTAFRPCANANDPAAATVSKRAFRTPRNYVTAYELERAWLMLASKRMLCRMCDTSLPIANRDCDEFACDVTGYSMSHIVYRTRCMYTLPSYPFAQFRHSIFSLSDRHSQRMPRMCTQLCAHCASLPLDFDYSLC
jgi:hypothetical protein